MLKSIEFNNNVCYYYQNNKYYRVTIKNKDLDFLEIKLYKRNRWININYITNMHSYISKNGFSIYPIHNEFFLLKNKYNLNEIIEKKTNNNYTLNLNLNELDIKFENISMYYPNDKPLVIFRSKYLNQYLNFFKKVDALLYNNLIKKYNKINNYEIKLLKKIKNTNIMLRYINFINLMIKIKLIKKKINNDIFYEILNYI